MTHRIPLDNFYENHFREEKLSSLSGEPIRTCSHCQRTTNSVLSTKDTLSHNFTQWDTLQENINKTLCEVCAWAYASPEAKTLRQVITKDNPNTPIPLPSEEGNNILLYTPPENFAAVFAITKQKQILPGLLQWGNVATDSRTFTWNINYSHFLYLVLKLKDFKVTEEALKSAEQPRFIPQAGADLIDFFHTWSEYIHLRQNYADLLPLFLWLSRTPAL